MGQQTNLHDTVDLCFLDIPQSLYPVLCLVLYTQVPTEQIPCSGKLVDCSRENYFCSQRRNKEQPCATVRSKQEAEDPCHASALPLNLAKGETSVSYLLKSSGKPGGGKKINQTPTNCFQPEAGCVLFFAHTGGSWR